MAVALLPLASLLRSSPKSYFTVPSIRSLGSPQLPSPDAGLSPSLGTRTGHGERRHVTHISSARKQQTHLLSLLGEGPVSCSVCVCVCVCVCSVHSHRLTLTCCVGLHLVTPDTSQEVTHEPVSRPPFQHTFTHSSVKIPPPQSVAQQNTLKNPSFSPITTNQSVEASSINNQQTKHRGG